jgi:hypothetical protein
LKIFVKECLQSPEGAEEVCMFQSLFHKLALVTASVITLVSLTSQAQFMGVEVGVRQQSASSEVAGQSINSEMGLQFGLTGALSITEVLLFRSGFLYTQSPFTIKGSPEQKYTFNYLEIPLTLMWKFSELGGVYGGVNLALPVSADCTNCGNTSVDKKTQTPWVIGGSFKFAPNFGVDVYYEMLSKVNDSFKDASAVGANLLITFD